MIDMVVKSNERREHLELGNAQIFTPIKAVEGDRACRMPF
jgi:hypothetical protein